VESRKTIVERVLMYERGDEAFFAKWEGEDRALRERLIVARAALPGIGLPDALLESVVTVVAELGVAGHRGDITVLKAAKALAAIKGLPAPDAECLSDAFRMGLPHRLKEDPFEETASGRKRLEETLARFGT
ncbi:MAG: magnesium chelatase ATPase subunit I, partial [Thermodesulfobacteriota bacterium]